MVRMAHAPTRRAVIGGLLSLTALRLRADEDALTLLRAPGVHALMRHALAPGTGDPPGFRLDDPSTQRNLDATGRAQAREAGRLLREAGVAFDTVLSSGWARCLETAELMAMGPVRRAPSLDSFFQRRARGPAQTRETLALLRALPPEAKALMVTHQVNVTALSGVYPRSGEIVAIRLSEAGEIAVAARLRT